MKSLRTYIIETLEHENKAMKRAMLKNKKALKDPKTVEFTVEVSMSIEAIDPPMSFFGKAEKLEDAFQEAHDKFEESGREFGGLLIYRVNVRLKGGAILEVPLDYWRKYSRQWERKKCDTPKK